MKTTLRSLARIAAIAAFSTAAAHAAPRAFDFKDPKGVNNVQFKLDAPLESITGTGTGISGTIQFDPTQPGATSGRIVLDAGSLAVGNPVMAQHLRGEQWLDVEHHASIVFEARSLENVRTTGAQTRADVHGALTIKGVTKEVVVPVTFTHLPDKLGARLNDPKIKGDLLVVRATFAVNRGDFGIQAGQMTDKVGEAIELSLSIAGSAPSA